MAQENRFSALSGALKNKQNDTEAPPQSNQSQQKGEAEAPPQKRKRGRPPGKRSDPNWEQIGLFLPVELHRQVKKNLIDIKDKDLSELVAELLQGWIEEQT